MFAYNTLLETELLLANVGTKLEKLPLLWSPMESLLECHFTEYSDTYMVGHTINEIMTHGQPPYDKIDLSTEQKIVQVQTHYRKTLHTVIKNMVLDLEQSTVSLTTCDELLNHLSFG